jgi:peptidoglycan hydrolase-like protein with peptidoglycan-binding domain
MRHPQVITLKAFLTKYGYLTDTSGTDYYGPLTTEAVQKFQKANNIVTTGTPTTTGYGAVGPKTREVINTTR